MVQWVNLRVSRCLSILASQRRAVRTVWKRWQTDDNVLKTCMSGRASVFSRVLANRQAQRTNNISCSSHGNDCICTDMVGKQGEYIWHWVREIKQQAMQLLGWSHQSSHYRCCQISKQFLGVARTVVARHMLWLLGCCYGHIKVWRLSCAYHVVATFHEDPIWP